MLRGLAAEGIYLGVVSNKTGALLRLETAQIGGPDYFVNVVGAGHASADKPDAAPVRLALASSGVEPGAAVWFVGDTGVDMECASNSGCIPILLGGEPASEELREFAPRLAFSDPATLFRFIQGL